MSYNYDIHELLYEANKEGGAEGISDISGKEYLIPYDEILGEIRQKLTTFHASELREAVQTQEAANKIRSLITQHVYQLHKSVQDMDSLSSVVDRLFDDMLGFSFLTKYIYDPKVEEIDCNRWDDVEIITENGYEKLNPHFKFLNPTQAIDTAKRMALLGGVVVDGAEPQGDSYITEGVRVFVTMAPATDEDAGVFFSIRKQKSKSFTEDELISRDTANKDELDFLRLCVSSGVSVGIAGETGSGKTADLAFLLDSLPIHKRIYTIEDSRELNLVKRDAQGNVISRVIHTKTRLSDIPKHNVDARKLMRGYLRCSPDVVAMAEMRGAEAMDVQEAGRTGHTILTTFHANSAQDAHFRVASMCMMAQSGFSEDMLMRFCYQALPIICFKKKLSDGSRKYLEIAEAVQTPNGYQMVTLFRFAVSGSKCDKDGNIIEVIGQHKQVHPISDALAYQLLINGADLKKIKRFAKVGYDPEKDGDEVVV